MVIAIIALLISILLPSLSKAREAGWMVKCGSNQRQIGMGSELYTREFDQWVIREAGTGRNDGSHCGNTQTWGWNYPWPRAWRPYLDSSRMWHERAAAGSTRGDEYRDHYEFAEYYHDPAYPSWDWHQIHYANNGMDLYRDDSDTLRWRYYKPLMKQHAIKFPSTTFAMTAYQDDDENNRYDDLYGGNRINKAIAIWYDVRAPRELHEGFEWTRASPSRHGQGSNVLRFDGHVSWEREEVVVEAANWDDHDDAFSRDKKCYHGPEHGRAY